MCSASARVSSDLWSEAGQAITTPLPRLSYRDAMERYGIDKPDLRYGLEIFDATDVFRGREFGITRQAIERAAGSAGSRRRAARRLSRKQLDEIDAAAKSLGAAGLLGFGAAAMRWKAGGKIPGGRRGCGAAARRRRPGARRWPARITSPARRCTGCAGAGQAAESDSGRGQPVRLDAGLPAVRAESRDRPPRAGESSVHRTAPGRPRACSRPRRSGCARSPTTRCSTATSWAAASSASPTRSCSGASSGCSVSPKRRRSAGSDSCSTGCGRRAAAWRVRVWLRPDRDAAGRRRSLRDVIAFPKTTAARALFEGAPTPVDPDDLRALHLEATEVRSER